MTPTILLDFLRPFCWQSFFIWGDWSLSPTSGVDSACPHTLAAPPIMARIVPVERPPELVQLPEPLTNSSAAAGATS